MAVKKAPIPPAAPTVWLTIEECAQLTRFSYSFIKAAIVSGDLRAYYPRGGRSVRIKAADIDAFMCAGD